MATKGNEVLTYADWAKRVDDKGQVDKIVEILNKNNEILTDMPVMEANDGTKHRTTTRTGLPRAAWRMLNYGVPKGKSTTAQVEDTTGMLEIYSEVDKDLADMKGNTKSFRLSEAKAFLEGMNQQMAETLWYGNTRTNPERFLGLAPRYSTGDTTLAASGENIVDGGGVGADNTSIWLICWGENTAHGIFPQGSRAGLYHQDLGEQTLKDAEGGQYQGYRDHFKWNLGFTLRDWRYVARIANIDVSDLIAGGDAALKALLRMMIIAEERIPALGVGKPVWYMNKKVRTALRLAILERTSNQLTWETVEGKRVIMFDGYPIRASDGLILNEARVPFPA